MKVGIHAGVQHILLSKAGARAGDWIVLDALGTLDNKDRVLELALLTEVNAEHLFSQETSFSTSLDGREWVSRKYGARCIFLTRHIKSEIENTLNCVQVDEKLADTTLIECSIRMEMPARYFKVTATGQNLDHTRWIVYEMWLRYLENL